MAVIVLLDCLETYRCTGALQACRGTLLDSGTLVSTDSSCGPGDSETLSSLRRIPIEADLLVAYAVQPGKCYTFLRYCLLLVLEAVPVITAPHQHIGTATMHCSKVS
ncbi:unnamed protein product [Hydatigera taeniaeformis]|uniref:Secreted protein n=1 Tax=Hydatigena taeniaeformis TaxID=6205 RepID=A0A0R3WVF2_HYDTA|nr:unnamed protein product [Hydatigera taeniaeformis]